MSLLMQSKLLGVCLAITRLGDVLCDVGVQVYGYPAYDVTGGVWRVENYQFSTASYDNTSRQMLCQIIRSRMALATASGPHCTCSFW